MQPTSKALVLASALVLGGLLTVGTTSALAQSGAPAAPGAYPAMPSNPGYRPAPAPAPTPTPAPAPAPSAKPRVSSWQKFKNFLTDVLGEDTGHSVMRKDPGTGRDETPGSKPWTQR